MALPKGMRIGTRVGQYSGKKTPEQRRAEAETSNRVAAKLKQKYRYLYQAQQPPSDDFPVEVVDDDLWYQTEDGLQICARVEPTDEATARRPLRPTGGEDWDQDLQANSGSGFGIL